MPTKTFENLPEHKKEIIIDAALKEFKRTLLKDASINKIIKDANISRGSFYNYFNDINDLYMYSLSNHKKRLFDMFNETLIESNGDLFICTNNITNKIIDFCILEKNKTLFKNFFLNINYHVSIRKEINKDELENKYKLLETISKINMKNIKIDSEEELFYIIDMLIGFIIHGLIEIFLDEKNEEIIKEKIKKQVEILKKGIYKEE